MTRASYSEVLMCAIMTLPDPCGHILVSTSTVSSQDAGTDTNTEGQATPYDTVFRLALVLLIGTSMRSRATTIPLLMT